MIDAMPRLLPLLMLVLAAPAFAQRHGDAVLVLADDGSLDPGAVHAIRSIAAGELRKRGITLADDRRVQGVRPVDSALSSLTAELGATRLFALRVGGRLGQKIPLSLEELSPQTLAQVSSAALTAMGLEECDVVTARLVEAVVDRRTVESTAGMTTLTATETKPFAKRPGERFWFIGLPVALYNGNRGTPVGFTLSYGYEAESFRLSATIGGFSRDNYGVSYLAMEGAWIPLDGEFSPFLGAGVGYMAAASQGGMGALVEGGLEAFRLHGVRALAGIELAIPFFAGTSTGAFGATTVVRTIYPAAFVRLAF
jgi:hypothetical protein